MRFYPRVSENKISSCGVCLSKKHFRINTIRKCIYLTTNSIKSQYNYWGSIVDAFQTSAIDAVSDEKLKYRAKMFLLSDSLLNYH